MIRLSLLLLILLALTGCTPDGENASDDFGIIPPQLSDGSNGQGGAVAASRLVTFSGDQQHVQAGASASNTLKVLALTADGTPIANIPVSFIVSGGGVSKGSLFPIVVHTDHDGIAETSYMAGSYVGNVTIQAISSAGAASFNLTVLGFTGFSISKHPFASGDTQSGAINSQLGSPFKLVLKDSFGQVVVGQTIRFVALGSHPGHFSGSVTADVVTDIDGVATAPLFNLSPIAGINQIRAQLLVDSNVFTDFSVTGTVLASSAISAGLSTVEFSSATVVADGLNVVEATLEIRDMYGNLIPNGTYGASISESFSQAPASPAPLLGASWNGAWSYQGVGTYKRSFTVSNTAGTLSLSAFNVNGVALTSAFPSISFISYGPFNPSMTELSVTVDPLQADGVSTTTVIATLKDNFGNAIAASGETIVLSTSAGTLIGSPVYHSATGTYRQILQAPTSMGGGSLTVSVMSINGIAIGGITKQVELKGGALSLANSNFELTNTLLGPGQTSILKVTLRDVFNNPLVLSGVDLSFSKTRIQGAGSPYWTAQPAGHIGSGVYQASMNADHYANNITLEEWSVTVTHPDINAGQPIVLNQKPRMQYIWSNLASNILPAATYSTVTLNSSSGVADNGQSFLEGTITLRSVANHSILAGGFSDNINVSTDIGTVSQIVDNNNGTYTFLIFSPASGGQGNVTVEYNGIAIPGTPLPVSFYGEASLLNTTLEASPKVLPGGGLSTITMRLRDASGGDIPSSSYGVSDVRFLVSGNGAMVGPVTKTSVSGKTTFSQTYERTAVPDFGLDESVNITAQILVDGIWSDLANSISLAIRPVNLAGVTIDCSNINTYRNKHLYVQNGTLRIASWLNGSIDRSGNCSAFVAPDHPFKFASLTIGNNGVVKTLEPSETEVYGIDIELSDDLNIEASGKIDVSGQGYLAAYGPDGNGAPQIIASSGWRTGGTYGNNSHKYEHWAKTSYGDRSDPNLPGIGPIHDGCLPPAAPTPNCGIGGGLVRVKAHNIKNFGAIQSKGYPLTIVGVASRGGSGGGVRLDVTGALTGTGDISVEGAGSVSVGSDWPGSGGRIAIYGDMSAYNLKNIKLGGGQKFHNWIAATAKNLQEDLISLPGTFYADEPLHGTHELEGYWELGPTSTHSRIIFSNDVRLTFASTARVTLDEAINITSLTMNGGALLTHSRVSTTLQPRVSVTASDFILIDVGAKIDVKTKGYAGAANHQNTLNGAANISCGQGASSALNFAPACHTLGWFSPGIPFGANHYTRGGGTTGAGSFNTGITWGDPDNPSSYGGGGAKGHSNPYLSQWCANGGGIIHLTTNQLIVNGSIDAGADGNLNQTDTWGCSGAAGGSIKIVADTISSPMNSSYIGSNGNSGDIDKPDRAFAGGAGGLINLSANHFYDGTDLRVSAQGGVAQTGGENGEDGVVTINGVVMP